MKKNEPKNSKAVTKQSKNTPPVAVAEAPDTKSEAGTEVEGTDNPRDGEGCEAVTVAIIETRHDDASLARLAARTVKKNLMGVDAEVVILPANASGETILQTIEQFIHKTTTERIVVMTDSMAILNPVTLHDIAIPKANRRGTEDGKPVYDFGSVNAPVMYHRSVLKELLPHLIQERPYASLPDEYFPLAYPEVQPVTIRRWNEDPFVLPVVSKNPPKESIESFAAWKKFLYVSAEKWPSSLLQFMEEKFPEE